jgi:hypothetical protein
MIRTNVWKQRMLEKLGKVEATGESPQITHQVEVWLSSMGRLALT